MTLEYANVRFHHAKFYHVHFGAILDNILGKSIYIDNN